MSDLLLLPKIFEIILILVALRTLLLCGILNLLVRGWSSVLFCVALGLIITAIILGGGNVALMVIKVFFFVLAIAYASNEPRIARWWLLVALVVELLSQASAGNVLNKLSAVPFLLVACIWAASRVQLGARELIIIILALGVECIQAFMLESRGQFIAIVMACFLLSVPLKFVSRVVIICAVSLPIVYPLLLRIIFLALTADTDMIAATSSNFDRSVMSAWILENLSVYPLVGPGEDVYADEINWIKSYGEQAISNTYDPHQFLLSAWIWLGSFAVAALYFAWCAIWFFKTSSQHAAADRRIRVFSILAILAILTFVLSPPDASRRVQVALLTGIAIVGLRDPSSLMRKR